MKRRYLLFSLSIVLATLVPVSPAAFSKDDIAHGQSASTLIAEGHHQLLGHSYKSAVQTLTSAVRAAPNNTIARRYLAYALSRHGEGLKSAQQWEAVIKLTHPTAYNQTALGDAYMEGNMPSKAVLAYQTAFRLDPDYDFARIGLIEAFQARGQDDLAIDLCKEKIDHANSQSSRYKELLDKLQAKQTAPESNSQEPNSQNIHLKKGGV